MNSRSCIVRLVTAAPFAVLPPVTDAEPSPRDICQQPTTTEPRPRAGFHQTEDRCRGAPRAQQRAHAWVEADGQPIGDPHPAGYYTPTMTVGPPNP
nr:lasso peptide biosynthesis protein [Streptomyces swartbergensis]